ncbi:pyridoxal phosphate-dependent aminotransferase [Massilia sp. YIM B02763]|uniref:pyridoxal phosphate-dependent aminotransferase n=1 Tax=Massilia sp. YIM B02763 TaxID=3050130 RepID=UPI0025B6A783|nr:pyridoxal phosphate-dependent aminotransferase [Massilia sp. YIM B02763]MDN4051808.1 pyridoxal phosphate-dependent aminotransferase [Massilia sp. YIM B02763]
MSSNTASLDGAARALQLAARVEAIEPFRVMEMVKAAGAMTRAGIDVVSMSVGEPDFTAPDVVARAAVAAIQSGATQYTESLGLPALREAIAAWYAASHGLDVDPRRIVITAGASAALLLACAALVADGDEVLMPDPCYPCNRHFVSAFGGKPVLVPSGAAERYQLTAAQVDARWNARTRGVIVASPSNPTGTSMTPQQTRELVAAVRARGGFAIVDEIYQGLSYGDKPVSALSFGDDVITVNSFSKYFSMTGWRLGWLVLPEALVPAVEKLAQNLFICAPTVAQRAALACFEPEAIAIFEERRLEFQRRRDFLVPALRELGFAIPVMPDGAFYVYADIAGLDHPDAADSAAFGMAVLRDAHVAIVPGGDFGFAAPERHVRFSYATKIERIGEAVGRIGRLLGR